MWLYSSAATHVFQHVVQRARANRRVAVPDFVICWAEFLTFGRLLVFGKEPRTSGSGDLNSF